MKFLWPIEKQHRWISGYAFTPPSHGAEDYGTPTGSAYRSPQAGIVKTADFSLPVNTIDPKLGYGNYIQIDHGSGWVSLAAHMLECYVKAGDVVTAGQLVARTNNTGNTTGAHCHIAMKLYGTPMKPSDLFVDVLEDEPPVIVDDPTLPVMVYATVAVDAGKVLLIRNYPKATSTSKIIGQLDRGTKLAVISIVHDGHDKWLQIGYNQYVCMQQYVNGIIYDLCKWSIA